MDDLDIIDKAGEIDLDWENMTMDQVINAVIIASVIDKADEAMREKEK